MSIEPTDHTLYNGFYDESPNAIILKQPIGLFDLPSLICGKLKSEKMRSPPQIWLQSQFAEYRLSRLSNLTMIDRSDLTSSRQYLAKNRLYSAPNDAFNSYFIKKITTMPVESLSGYSISLTGVVFSQGAA
jgi:hypothetical protein